MVLLTDKLDKSEVEKGRMTMSWRSLFSVTCTAVVPFVSALSARRSSRISLWSQFAAHVHSICGVGGLFNVHLAEFSLQGRLGCGSPARCLLFSVFASASCDWWLLAEFFLFVAVVLSQGVHGERHEGTAFPAMRVRPSTGRSVCERNTRYIEERRRLCAKQVHHTAQASAQADTRAHTQVHVAMWCGCFLKRMPVERGVWGRHIKNGHACSPKGTPHQHWLVLTESEQAFTEFTWNPHKGTGARPMPSEDETSLAARSQQNHFCVVLLNAPS